MTLITIIFMPFSMWIEAGIVTVKVTLLPFSVFLVWIAIIVQGEKIQKLIHLKMKTTSCYFWKEVTGGGWYWVILIWLRIWYCHVSTEPSANFFSVQKSVHLPFLPLSLCPYPFSFTKCINRFAFYPPCTDSMLLNNFVIVTDQS